MATYTYVATHEIKDMSIGITFEFSNPMCDILKEKVYDNDGNPIHSLKLKPNGYFRDYYYQMGAGLISRDDLTPPLTALSKIKSENDAIDFIEKYGYLFRMSENKYIGISVNDVFRAVKRINSLFRLMFYLDANDKYKDRYVKILQYMSFLIFSNPIAVDNFKSYVHPLFDRVAHKNGDSYILNVDVPFFDYDIKQCSVETEDGIEDIMTIEETETDPCAILYDFLIEKRLISNFDGEIMINADNITLKDYRDMIMTAARITLKRELDYIMHNVVPVYDEVNLSASWNIPDLFSALTFAIFFSDKNKQQWKICENPACQCVFQTSATNTRKKYCSTKCCNEASKIRMSTRR